MIIFYNSKHSSTQNSFNIIKCTFLQYVPFCISLISSVLLSHIRAFVKHYRLSWIILHMMGTDKFEKKILFNRGHS